MMSLIENEYPYETLAALATAIDLPKELRSAALNLITTLYVDVAPQVCEILSTLSQRRFQLCFSASRPKK